MALHSFGPTSVINALAKSDTTYYDPPLDAIYAGGAGHVDLFIEGKSTVAAPIVYTLAAQGLVKDVGRIRGVVASTTATLLVGIGAGAKATA